MMRRSRSLLLFAVLIYIFLYLPLVVVACQSFNASRLGLTWGGLTGRWYASALQNPQIVSALKNTLLVAVVSTLFATVLGTLLGYGLARHHFRGTKLISRLLLLPIAVPDIVMAVSLLLFYSVLRQWTGLFHLGLGAMIVAHITFQIPFVALVVRSRLAGINPAIGEAAADLGASRWQRFWHVTLPMLRPGIVAGALLAFALSLDDFVVSFFTAGPGSTTLPIYIYSSVKRGVSGEIHAVSTMLIVAALLGTIVVTWWQARNKNLLLVMKPESHPE
jgi:spermidine/putrescine transport system permease protein